jgi:pimeloyl-ACP methyl ester carboxylesterase
MNLWPLVLVHGFPLDRRMWPMREELARGRTVLAPNLPGFGGTSAPPRPGFIGAYAAFLLAETDRAGIGRAVFCGLSMGGYVVFELLRRAPERVAGLVLCDTRAEADPPEARGAREAAIALVEAGRRAEFLGGFTPRLFAPAAREDPILCGLLNAMGESVSDEGLCVALEALRDRPDSRPLLPEIRVPALVLVGEEDAVTPPALAESMNRAIPGSRLEVIPGAGHLVPLERPDVFKGALDRFLREAGL